MDIDYKQFYKDQVVYIRTDGYLTQKLGLVIDVYPSTVITAGDPAVGMSLDILVEESIVTLFQPLWLFDFFYRTVDNSIVPGKWYIFKN